MTYGRKVFDKIPEANIASWNAKFRGYAMNELHREVVVLFSRMKKMDVMPNCFTFPVVLKSCMKSSALREGEEVHCFVIKNGFGANHYVGTTLIELYSGGNVIKAAYKVFGEMVERNVVVWTSMINGYISCGDIASARCLFDLAPERDVILWNTMVSGYIELGDMLEARKLFDHMPKKDVMSWNTVLSGYAINGNVEECNRLFEEMPEKNVFSWNALIGGYARNGCFFEVLDAFKRMLNERNVLPNDATLVTVLSACARLGALDLGKWVHLYAESNGYKGNLYVGNALVDMYAKCGVIENAVDVFKGMDKKDLISWNTIIGGLAMHGRGVEALNLFSQMKNAAEAPDGITFIGILCTCTHMGLVEDGLSYFNSMVDDYSIVPQIEHYGCMVDLLTRAGRLAEAVDFIRKMPIEADAVIWANLLGSCRVHKNVELAELALERLTELEPKNPANFVVLSNIYGDLGRWKDVARVKVAMRDTGFKKLPGCSSIEVNEAVVEFYSLDERHPETEEIYRTLKGLTKLLKSSGYVPDVQLLRQRT
ncbi:pentatricopeptide repeat-containing protein At1g08070, chloroplastic-like [Pistacia vera]|uniref:pentatricopeptide repeat-containing protein At1g08070, chloroplastic-like n=1 Tax=Pistacia vera TaxID=55513 RepID=UPI001262CC92|nr:pentatricopeptide repeat-containing protein At1g08070, chloroplastic-like [Pistacia vera]